MKCRDFYKPEIHFISDLFLVNLDFGLKERMINFKIFAMNSINNLTPR